MENAQIYQLDWSGRGSNIYFIFACALFILVIVWCLRSFFRAVREVRRSSNPKAEWRVAESTILSTINVIFWAVLAGIGGGSGSSGLSSGITTGYASNSKPNTTRVLGISIFGVLLLAAFLIHGIFFEQPLQLAVSPRQVTLLYRLRWRDQTIPIAAITDVSLPRYRDRGGRDYHYNLLIRHNGRTTKILGTNWTKDWYKQQMKEAYNAIQGQLRLRHKGVANPPTAPTTKRNGGTGSSQLTGMG